MQLVMFSHVDVAGIGGPQAVAMLGTRSRSGSPSRSNAHSTRGRLSLASTDREHHRVISSLRGRSEKDLRWLVEGVRLAWQVAHQPEIARHTDHVALLTEETTSSDEALATYIRATVTTQFHPCGTARMGPADDAMAVIDQHCRLARSRTCASLMRRSCRASRGPTSTSLASDRRARVRLDAGRGIAMPLTRSPSTPSTSPPQRPTDPLSPKRDTPRTGPRTARDPGPTRRRRRRSSRDHPVAPVRQDRLRECRPPPHRRHTLPLPHSSERDVARAPETRIGRAASVRRRTIGARPTPASVRSSSDAPTARIHAPEEWVWRPVVALVALARWLKQEFACRCCSRADCGLVLGCRPYPRQSMSGSVVLDAAGRRRSPATMPGFHAGHPRRNKGLRYTADPPSVEEIVAVMRIAGDGGHGRRLRGLIVVLWRAGLRIDEALALREADLDRRRGSILVRRGKGGRRREIGMDDWGWQELEPWLIARVACRSVRCSASSTDAPAVARGPRVGHAPSCAAPPLGPGCADALHLINCATHTRSRWPAKASVDRHPTPARTQ